MHWFFAALVLFGFAGPSAVVGVGFSVGALGLVLGPIVVLVTTWASVQGALFLAELIKDHPDVDSLQDLGRAVLGTKGAWWGLVVQQGNFLLYLPVALEVCGSGLQGAVDPEGEHISCGDYWLLLVAGVCFVMMQMRSLENVTELSFLSLVCCGGTILIALVVVADNPQTSAAKQDAYLVGNPQMTQDGHRYEGYTNFFLGMTTCAWAYVPSFLTVELANANAMEDPDSFPKALWLSAWINIVVFLGFGTFLVLQWGWDVMDPLMLGTASDFDAWPATHVAPRVLNALWFVASLISFALDAVLLARQCQRWWDPNFPVDDWSLASVLRYALITLPVFMFAVVAALVVPSLFAMLAVVTALTVPWANMILPAVLYWTHRRGGYARVDAGPLSIISDGLEAHLVVNEDPNLSIVGDPNKRPPPRGPMTTAEQAAAAGVFTMGAFMFVVCAVAAVGKLAIRDLRGPVQIGCYGWLLYEDDYFS